ncbi:MAG: DUF1592 domain-containing protein [Vicinamibacterales bacterium]
MSRDSTPRAWPRYRTLCGALAACVALGSGAYVTTVSGQNSGRPVAPQAPAAANSADEFAKKVYPVLSDNCATCHNDVELAGNLNMELFRDPAVVAQKPQVWAKVHEMVTSGKMPPDTMPPLEPGDAATLVTWLERTYPELALSHADPATADPGRVTARRLNRAEYNYTVRDLLGVDFHPADNFPQDDAGYGFDNNGDVLSLSVVLMEKYLAAAEVVARTAVYGPQSVKPVTGRYQPLGRRRPGDPDNLFLTTHPNLSLTSYDESGLAMPNSFHVRHRFPATGDYIIRATPDNGMRPSGSEALEIAAFVDGAQVGLASIDGSLEGRTQEFPVRVTAGEHWVAVGFPRQFEGLPAAYGAKNPSKRPVPEGRGRRGGGAPPGGAGRGAPAGGAGRGVIAPPPGVGPANGNGAAANNANNNDDAPSLNVFVPPGAPPGTRLARPDTMGVQSMEIAGPAKPEVRPSPESVRAVFVCTQKDTTCLRRIVTNLVQRGYRTPVGKLDVDQVLAHALRVRKRGDSFDEQVVVAIQALLVSPKFLFRIESDRVAAAPAAAVVAASRSYYLTDHELASRLSYFLWSSMPDDELRQAAERGTLRQPAVLTAQVQRMLKDPKIGRFVENFGGQWLQFRALESQRPDFYKFPLWDNYLRMSAEQETRMFVENLIRDDRSIVDFLDADYTFVNEYLAGYYGLTDVKGPEFRRVSLANTPRRGVLGQASVLTATSYADRTSVVLRGKWILENILNAPPPPPPPNVPDLDVKGVGEGATLRQRMEAHRNNPVCASCHRNMDPLGFGLENFDAIGSWRDKEGPTPVDSSGTLPDGKTFKGPVELSAFLRTKTDAFVQGLSEKMLTYALGRGIEKTDRPAVKQIAAGVNAADHKFSSVVLEIVKSRPFQMRNADKEPTK